MEDKIFKWLMLVILITLCYGLLRPVLIDQKNLQVISQVLQRHEQDLNLLKQKQVEGQK